MNAYLEHFSKILHGPISYVFVYIALPASIFFIIMIALSLFSDVFDTGEAIDIDTDTDTDADNETSDWSFVKYVTLKNVVYFLTFFSWSGIVLLELFSENTRNTEIIVLLLAASIALILTIFLNLLFVLLLVKSQSIVVYDLNKLLNKTGQVYLSMNPEDVGQIQIELNGALETIDSKNVSSKKLIVGEQVKVTAIVGKMLHVSSL